MGDEIRIRDICRSGDRIEVSTNSGEYRVKVVKSVSFTEKYADRVKVQLRGEDKARYIKVSEIPDKVVCRTEDVDSSLVLDLRYQESMLESRIAELSELERTEPTELTVFDLYRAKQELRKTLNAVRQKLKSHGARTSEWNCQRPNHG